MTSRCRRSRWAGAAAAVSVLLAFHASWAQQTTTGSIGGRVTDASAMALPGATVIVISGQGSRSYATDSEGRFLAPYLTPGLYKVRVELAGFASAERSDVEVRLGQRVDLSFSLPAGTFADTIEVKGAAPLIDFSSASVSTTVESSFLGQVPVGRRLGEILYLAPGVSRGAVPARSTRQSPGRAGSRTST